MKITLYEKCDLTSEYKDTFRNIELLNQYLNTLPNSEIDLPTNYWNLNGSIILDYDASKGITNGRVWNYIKIVDTTSNNFIYAFIDNFELFNDAMRISYSCDYWHTFLPKFSIRESFILNSRYVPRSENGEKIPFSPPLDYISNSPLFTSFHNESGKISIIAEFQSYALTTAGGKYVPRTFSGVIAEYHNDGNIIWEYDINEINDIIDKLSATQSGVFQDENVVPKLEEYVEQQPKNYKYYKIINLYTVPSSFLRDTEGNLIFDMSISNYTKRIRATGMTCYVLKPLDNIYNKKVEEYTIPPSTLFRSYGFYTFQKPYLYNGLNKSIKISISFDDYDFKVYIIDENGIDDITSVFYASTNFDFADAQSLVQQKMNRDLRVQTLENAKGTAIINMIGSGVQIGVGIAQTGLGVASAMTSSNATGAIGGGAMALGGITTAIGGVTGIANGFVTLDTLNAQIKNENASKYSNSFGVSNNDFNRYNAFLGFCINTLDSEGIINADEYENAIKNIGFRIGFYSNSLDLDVTNYDIFGGYNPIKFGYVKISGLPSSISFIIERILLSGTKIWYKGDLL